MDVIATMEKHVALMMHVVQQAILYVALTTNAVPMTTPSAVRMVAVLQAILFAVETTSAVDQVSAQNIFIPVVNTILSNNRSRW